MGAAYLEYKVCDWSIHSRGNNVEYLNNLIPIVVQIGKIFRIGEISD